MRAIRTIGWPKRKCRRFHDAQDGAVAVEFALVSIPFVLLLLATVETFVVFFAASDLEGAVGQASRLIRTGQVQNNGLTEAQYKQLICDRFFLARDCDANLRIDVRTFQNFNNVNFVNPLTGTGELRNNFTFQPGVAGDIILVRAFYSWPIAVPGNIGLDNMAGSKRLLSASMAFRNEPF